MASVASNGPSKLARWLPSSKLAFGLFQGWHPCRSYCARGPFILDDDSKLARRLSSQLLGVAPFGGRRLIDLLLRACSEHCPQCFHTIGLLCALREHRRSTVARPSLLK
jgi:hypothetical protein